MHFGPGVTLQDHVVHAASVERRLRVTHPRGNELHPRAQSSALPRGPVGDILRLQDVELQQTAVQELRER